MTSQPENADGKTYISRTMRVSQSHIEMNVTQRPRGRAWWKESVIPLASRWRCTRSIS